MKKNYILLLAFFTSVLSMNAQVLGYAICFDGINDFAPVYRSGLTNIFGDNSDNDDFTIEFWTKDYGNGGKHLYSKHNDNAGTKEGYFIERSATGAITVGMANNTNNWTTITGVTSISDGDWYHIAVTFDVSESRLSLYMNGSLEASIVGFTPVFGNNVDARLASSEYENTYYGGAFDEVRVWTSVRAANDISLFKNVEIDLSGGVPSDLLLYYKCNEGIPDNDNWILYQLVDHTGNGRPGDLWNVSRWGSCSNWIHTVPDATLSVDTFENNSSEVNLYPNPAKNFVQINGLKANETYTIYNTIGAVVKSGTVSNNQEIAINNLTSGLYFLKFKNGKTIKFIKK